MSRSQGPQRRNFALNEMKVIKVRIVFLILQNSQALPLLCLLNILRFLRKKKKRRTKKKCYSCILLVDIPTALLPGKLAPLRFSGKLWRKVKDKQLLAEWNPDFVCTSVQVQYVEQRWEGWNLLRLSKWSFLLHLKPERFVFGSWVFLLYMDIYNAL